MSQLLIQEPTKARKETPEITAANVVQIEHREGFPCACEDCRPNAVNVLCGTAAGDVGDPVSGDVEFRNLPVPQLVEMAIARREGFLAANGAFVAYTSPHTGRSPKDKFIVGGEVASERVWWEQNSVMYPSHFTTLLRDIKDYVRARQLFVFNGYAGADPTYRLAIRVKTEYAWHNLFAHQLFIRPDESELATHYPHLQVICVPGFEAKPARHGTHSGAFIVLNLDERIVLIGGTRYAGEIKKAVFTVMNYLMPFRGVLPMHCSANMGEKGDVALFFGLSGTGKTSLSTTPNRHLIGDDEHGWGDEGIFNFEGGCYAKCVDLSREREPEICNAIRFGSVLENVVLGEEGLPNYADRSITENTRCAYPVDYIPGAVVPGVAGHPERVIFLTADATGVLPPVSKLTGEQAMVHFLDGYTSKLAGTENGVTRPTAAFSACFGQPFLPLAPMTYAKLLARKLKKHDSKCYLVNTGWTGGPYGVGRRISLAHTRAIVDAILNGSLDDAPSVKEPFFGLELPLEVPGVPADELYPRNTWPVKEAYDSAARQLVQQFANNYKKYENAV
jgi:phosphoenolpyruvate carboxykinase (ATP)